MPDQGINVFSEDINFSYSSPETLRDWITRCINSEGAKPGDINIVFCSDPYLLEINQNHLGRDYLTDIITFDQSEDPNLLEGDLFISVDRVRDNAKTLGFRFEEELDRVIVHGVLHLLGFDDKDKEGAEKMREKENACLLLRSE